MNVPAGPVARGSLNGTKERETDAAIIIGVRRRGRIRLAALGSAIAVGLIGMAASTAVGRNPGGSTKILVQSILAIAFAEAIMFYTLFLVKQ
jgi:F-type H+-transporting ATPase subunit c